MESKLSLKWSYFIVLMVGIFFSVFIRVPNQPSYAQISFSAQNVSGLPMHIKIPGINVDASIEQVGLAPDGAMDVPQKPDDTAWFNLGPRPGEIGSAVIDGHSGYKNNKPAIFDNLSKLQKGDKIYVEDSNGGNITFVVQDFRSYDPKADAVAVFSSNDGIAHLNLITCSGAWNETARTHSTRLVVFADKVAE